jgi:hypothetical protein
MVHCHCSRCRKGTGTGHATNLYVEPNQLRWVSGGGFDFALRPPVREEFWKVVLPTVRKSSAETHKKRQGDRRSCGLSRYGSAHLTASTHFLGIASVVGLRERFVGNARRLSAVVVEIMIAGFIGVSLRTQRSWTKIAFFSAGVLSVPRAK